MEQKDLFKGLQTTVLEEAGNLVDGIREEEYGPPEEVYEDVAEFWALYLDDDSIDSEDVCTMLILMKLVRQ